MLKALLAAAVILAPLPALAFDGWGSFYAEVYGGAQLGNESSYLDTDTFPMNTGGVLGGAVGVELPVPGLSFEVDLMGTSTEYADYPDYFIHTLSLMGVVEYAVPLNEMFEVYGAVGLGGIQLVYDAPTFTEVGWGAGYQAAIGARAGLTENVAVFAEAKFQDSFQEIETTNYAYGMPTFGLLAGVRVSQ
jgi:opacity protein-like surface antigen